MHIGKSGALELRQSPWAVFLAEHAANLFVKYLKYLGE